MPTKPKILLQNNVFVEDQLLDTEHAISKYFEVETIPDDFSSTIDPKVDKIRGSLALMKWLKKDLSFFNVMRWFPEIRELTITFTVSNYYFLDLQSIQDGRKIYDNTKFLKPAGADCIFPGGVYTSTRLHELIATMNDKQISPRSVMCLLTDIKEITEEYRVVIVNGKVAGSCMYKYYTKEAYSRQVPADTLEFAVKAMLHPYLAEKPNIVLDIGKSSGKNFIIDINPFETSSFYICDHDNIYRSYAKTKIALPVELEHRSLV